MKHIYGLLISFAIFAIQASITCAAENTMPEFNNRTYSGLKEAAVENIKKDKIYDIKATAVEKQEVEGNRKTKKISISFTVSELEEIMTAEDYGSFLDSLVIKQGELKCADNRILWKYSDNTEIRNIGRLLSEKGNNCSKKHNKIG